MRISDKSFVEVFKYIKDINTSINHFGEITCVGNGNEIELYFEANSFYILYATLKGSNAFIDWGKDKQFAFPLETLKTISKCLKKNMLAIEYDDTTFSFCVSENEEETKINLEVITETPENKNKKEKILKELNKNKDVSVALLENDLFQLFLDSNNEVSEEATEDKLVEIPTKKILSATKNCSRFTVSYSEKVGDFRYVSLESENDLIKMNEILAVI